MGFTSDELRKLRAHYRAMLGEEKVLESLRDRHAVGTPVFSVLETLINRIGWDFPNLLPMFIAKTFDLDPTPIRISGQYDRAALAMYVAGAFGTLQGHLEQSVRSTPVTERLDFSFPSASELRSIVERDFVEVQRAYISECWKSVIILCGGLLETILLDALIKRRADALSAKGAPKGDLDRWPRLWRPFSRGSLSANAPKSSTRLRVSLPPLIPLMAVSAFPPRAIGHSPAAIASVTSVIKPPIHAD